MGEPRTALIFGGRTGLLGQALSEALCRKGWRVTCPTSNDIDIFDAQALAELVETSQPDRVFNTVVYTNVDQAEEEPQKALELNRTFPARLARVLKSAGVPLVHYSTDFIFDGRSDVPYTTEDQPNPQSEYGRTKLAGEQALQDSGLDQLLILRTAWLFGPWKTNFVHKILGLAATQERLTVVFDQVGSPTYTLDVAAHTLQLVERGATGIFHVVNSGQASWCELANEAVHQAGLTCRVLPIPSCDFPQRAERPGYSVLDTSKLTTVTKVKPRAWLQSLRDYIFRG